MFEADYNDIELGLKTTKTEWAVVAPAYEERGKMKQDRGQARFGNAGVINPAGSHLNAAPRHRNRASRIAKREKSEEQKRAQASNLQHKTEPLDPSVTMLPSESEDFNVEYKLRLKDPSQSRLQQLITQMKYRLSEGAGECFYYVGVEDHGYPRGLSEHDLRASLNNLNYMAEALRSSASIVRVFPGAHGRLCALVHVRRNCVEDVNYTELRVCVGGSVDNGKSSLIAVLTRGIDGAPVLDNGKGSVRTSVFRHKHEIQTGHTSSISQTMLGYDERGRVLNYCGVASLTTAEISAAAHRVLHFVDLGGHERFLKTALYGMTSLLPDFMLLCVCAATGIAQITKEHFAAAVALDIPVLCVITKADASSPAALSRTLLEVRTLLATAADAARSERGGPMGASTESLSDADAFDRAASTEVFESDVESAAELRTRQALKRKLDRQVPIVDTPLLAEQYAQVMGVIQQQQPPLRCRSFVIPCFVTSAVSGAGINVLHCFLNGLEQSARHKQPLSAPLQRGMFDSFARRLGPLGGPVDAAPAQTAAPLLRPSEAPPPGVPGASANAPLTHDHLTPAAHAATEVLALVAAAPLSSSPRAHAAPQSGAPPHSRSNGANGAVPVAATAGSVSDSARERGGGAASQSAEGAPAEGPNDEACADLVHFQIDHIFDVNSVGTVVSGTVVVGVIRVGDRLWWGPDNSGAFALMQVVSIHRSQVPVTKVSPGQTGTLALDAPAAPAPAQLLSTLFSPSSTAAVPSLGYLSDDAPQGVARHSTAPLPSHGAPCLHRGPLPGVTLEGAAAPAPAPGGPASLPRNGSATGAASVDVLDSTAPLSGEASCSRAESTTARNGGASVCRPPDELAQASHHESAPAPHTPGEPNTQCAHSSAADDAAPDAQRSTPATSRQPPTSAPPAQPDSARNRCTGSTAPATQSTPAPSAANMRTASMGSTAQLLIDDDCVCTDVEASRVDSGPTLEHSDSAPVIGAPSGAALRRLPLGAEGASPAGHGGLSSDLSTQLRLSQPGVPLPVASSHRLASAPGAISLARSGSPSQLASSPDASLEPSWRLLGLGLAGLPEEAEDDAGLAAAKGRKCKGTVLLDQRISPRAASRFDAVLVLLSGQWPPRGLLSGRWPPRDDDARDGCGAVSSPPSMSAPDTHETLRKERPRRCRARSQRLKYKHTIHCGSIRQEAEICFMQEVHESSVVGFEVDGTNILAAAAAADILASGDEDPDADESENCVGCVVEVQFKFALRPEWLQPGMRFLIRDHSGHISGAGVIRHVHDAD